MKLIENKNVRLTDSEYISKKLMNFKEIVNY